MAKPNVQFFLIAMSVQFLLSPLALAQYSRGRSAAVGGVKGAIVGAGVGALLGGKSGARTGALIGGGLGVLSGARAANRANLAAARENAAQAGLQYESEGSALSGEYSSDEGSSEESLQPTYVSEKYFSSAMAKLPEPYKLLGSYYEFITNDTNGGSVIDPDGSKTIAKVSDVSKITSCAERALNLVKRFTAPQAKIVMVYMNNRLHQSKEADTYIVPTVDLVAGVICGMRDPSASTSARLRMIECTPDKVKVGTYDRRIDLYGDVFYSDQIDSVQSVFRDGAWHTVETQPYLISRMTYDANARDYIVYHNQAPIESQNTQLAEMGRAHSNSTSANVGEFQPILNHELDILHRDYDRLPGELTKLSDANYVEIFKQIPLVEKRIVPRIDMQIGITSNGTCVLPNTDKLAKNYVAAWKNLVPAAPSVANSQLEK